MGNALSVHRSRTFCLKRYEGPGIVVCSICSSLASLPKLSPFRKGVDAHSTYLYKRIARRRCSGAWRRHWHP